MNRTKWLICLASPGQFSDEVAIHGIDYAGNEFELFTSRRFVRFEHDPSSEKEVDARLQTVLLESKDNLCLIQLPGQTFDNGSSITVRADQLEEDSTLQPA